MWQRAFDPLAKLTCRWRYGQLLSAYLDNELDMPTAKAIGSHLSACDRCRVEFDQLRFASRAMVELELSPARNSLTRGQVLRLPAFKEVSAWKRLYRLRIAVPLPLAASVSIIFVSVILLAIFRNSGLGNQSSASRSATDSVVIKVVEVPVERVVTRTVYLKQPGSGGVRGTPQKNRLTTSPSNYRKNIAQNKTVPVQWSNSSLRDFRPAASANLRVVREPER